MTAWRDLSNSELVARMVQRGYPEALARRCVDARDRDDRSGREARARIASVLNAPIRPDLMETP